MKSRETLIRLHRFQVDEKRQKVADIESMIADFERMQVELQQQILAEQERTGISDVTHFAYPTFAKAALNRRDNLLQSIEELKVQLDEAKEELQEAYAELKKFELIHEKDEDRRRSEELMRGQKELDDVGISMYRRPAHS